jgi:hypothetical protein
MPVFNAPSKYDNLNNYEIPMKTVAILMLICAIGVNAESGTKKELRGS